MGIMDKIRGLLAGPTQVGGSGAESDAALSEDERTQTAGDAQFAQAAEFTPTYGSLEAAETAEEDLETEEAPPDSDP